MTVTEMKKSLIRENFEIEESGGRKEIKMMCKNCHKHFYVDLGIAASGMIKNGACVCSPCGSRTLVPVRK